MHFSFKNKYRGTLLDEQTTKRTKKGYSEMPYLQFLSGIVTYNNIAIAVIITSAEKK